MYTNVIFFSPRYIRYEYFGVLLGSLDVRKIFSFLPLNSLPYSSATAIRRYRHSEYDQTYDSKENYSAFIMSIASEVADIASSTTDKELKPESIRNATVLIIADWEENMPYNQILEANAIRFKRWNKMSNIFPYTNKYGDATDAFVNSLHSYLSECDKMNLLEEIAVKKISVFFHSETDFVLSYDFTRKEWRFRVYVNRKTKKRVSYVYLWKQKMAKENEDSMVYSTEDGKKKIRLVVLDVMSQDVKRWRQYEEEKEERLRRLERMESGWYDNDDNNNDDDREQGCGNGWSCNHCPNVGCPANEYN